MKFGWPIAIAVFLVCVSVNGIELPPGNHEIRFVFRPLLLRLGGAISAVSLIGVACLIFRRNKPRIKRIERIQSD